MSGKHLVLVVEDHADTSEDLQQILSALDCDVAAFDNKADALEAVTTRSFCLCLLDLEIRGARGGIRGHVEHGRSLLREIRGQFLEHTGRCHRLPILVVSGFARERDEALEVMDDGANGVVQKPLSSATLSAAVRKAFETSGRATHEACSVDAATAAAPSVTKDRIVVAIPGDRDKRRVRVTVDGHSAALSETSLTILLHLMLDPPSTKGVHKTDLGGDDDAGFRGASVLSEQLNGAFRGAGAIVENRYHGLYKLSAKVVIGEINVDKLAALDNAVITALAKKLVAAAKRRRNAQG